MRPTTLFPLLTLLAAPAVALDSTCAIYLDAAEKSASQPARHSISEPGDGSTLEAIYIDQRYFTTIDGKWMRMPGANLQQGEKNFVAAIRSGKYAMKACRKIGAERIDGMSTTVIAYVLELPGTPVEETRAYIGTDGLVYRQTSGKTRVRYRYTGVRAPAL